MRLLALALLQDMPSGPPPNAAGWVPIGETNGGKQAIQVSTMTWNGRRATVEVRRELPRATRDIKFVVSRYTYDCGAKSFRIETENQYDAKGAFLTNLDGFHKDPSFTPVGDGTPSALTIKQVCALEPKAAPPSSALPSAALRSLGRDKWGDPQCGFVAVPQLTISEGQFRTARFESRSRDRGGQSYLSVSFQPAFNTAQWHGLLPVARFIVTNDALVSARYPLSATVTIDGRTSALATFLSRENGDPLSRMAVGLKAMADEIPRVGELAAGSIAVVRLFNASGTEISSDTFDVSQLRHVPGLLGATGWKCPAPGAVSSSPSTTAAAPAFASASDAQRVIVQSGDKSTFLYRGSVPAVLSSVAIRSDGPCRTVTTYTFPERIENGVTRPADSWTVTTDWKKVTAAEQSPDGEAFVDISEGGSKPAYALHLPADHQRALAAARYLMKACA